MDQTPDSSSILDKVIQLKEQQDQASLNASEIIELLLSELDSKESDIIKRRHAFNSERKETLEHIGKQYDVTRERIRQLERQGIEKMKQSPQYEKVMRPVEQVVEQAMNEHGGVMQEGMVYDYFLGEDHDKDNPQRRYWAFLMNHLLQLIVKPLPKNGAYERGWQLHSADLKFVNEVIEALEDIMKNHGKPQDFDQVFQVLQDHAAYHRYQAQLSDQIVLSLLHVAAKLNKNPYEEYGLRDWGHIQPKRMHDRIYLVLKKHGKPMHFEEIAKEVSRVFGKKAYPPTVHNELILNKEYVLVGRGMYALREWGYKEGIVIDIVEDVLRKADRPMDREEIVDAVLEQRFVKRNTVLLALTNKKLFTKLADGRYTLAKQGAKA